jgi:GNAT superfamily N-acetyltransferase
VNVRARKAVPSDLAGLSALFDAAACACHCRYWFFEGTKNDWLARSAFEPEKNRNELAHELATEPLTGVVAELVDGASGTSRLIGWMRLTERARVPRLRNLPVYRMLDLGDDAMVASISCFLIHPEHRGRGVAHELVGAAVELTGATHDLEAYPRRAMQAQRLSDEEAWLGPLGLFAAHGFTPLSPGALPGPFSASTDTYPVYRRPRGGGGPKPSANVGPLS